MIVLKKSRYKNALTSCLIRLEPCSLTYLFSMVIIRFLSPLSVVPLVALVGFGLYQLGFPQVCMNLYSAVVKLLPFSFPLFSVSVSISDSNQSISLSVFSALMFCARCSCQLVFSSYWI